LRKNEKLATVQTMKATKNTARFDALFPLIAGSITVILCIAIVASYIHTANRQPVVILPGGVTYTGK